MIESQGSGRDASVRVRTPQAIFLVGFMGTGKTAVGHAMSQRLGWRFEDLDVSIATREQRTIAEIFREFGELHFRKLEHAALAELVNAARLGSHFIVALGGGAFVQSGNAELLTSPKFATVFLDTPIDELWERCCAPGEAERPLRSDPEQFRKLFEARIPHYQRASVTVRTSGKSIDQVAEEVLHQLRLQTRNFDKEK
jgi:shikimate kinase